MSNWPDEMDGFTGKEQFNAVYTIQLGELVEAGVFDWSMPILDWSEAQYDEAQYKRVCDYFIERFYFREISLEPFWEWARTLHRKLVYELMPKYRLLYAREAEGINPLSSEDEYYKERTITSEYPETLLSGNSDYITSGRDFEHQKIREMGYADGLVNFADKVKSVDDLLLTELESMFISLYTTNYNACW